MKQDMQLSHFHAFFTIVSVGIIYRCRRFLLAIHILCHRRSFLCILNFSCSGPTWVRQHFFHQFFIAHVHNSSSCALSISTMHTVPIVHPRFPPFSPTCHNFSRSLSLPPQPLIKQATATLCHSPKPAVHSVCCLH